MNKKSKFLMYIFIGAAFTVWVVVAAESTLIAIDRDYTYFEHWMLMRETLFDMFRLR